jgi:alkane 1-monooxygenase
MEDSMQNSLRAIPYLLAYILPILYLVEPLYVPLFIFIFVPVADLILGKSNWNPEKTHVPLLFELILWLWPFLQIFLLGLALSRSEGFQIIDAICFGIISGGIGITYAHELIHRKNRVEVFLGEILLSTVFYLHWRTEHLRGHHAKVATPEDPASAPKGMNVYRFFLRSIWGSWISVFHLESERLRQKKLSPWSLQNRMYAATLIPIAIAAGIFWYFGLPGLVFFVVQGITAILLLEVVNYIEHYGLQRKKLESGNWERPSIQISWNANQRLTNYFLINLQRHSDHHARPRVPYPLLRSEEESPLLPLGYTGMIILALFPPLFFRIMNPRVPEQSASF